MIWAVLEVSNVRIVPNLKLSHRVADKLTGQNRVLYVGRIHVTDDIGTVFAVIAMNALTNVLQRRSCLGTLVNGAKLYVPFLVTRYTVSSNT